MQIKVEIKDGEVRTMLMNLMNRTGNLSPVMETIGGIVRRSILKNFDASGRPNRWQPSKRALKTGGKTLIDRAILKNSINYKAFRNRVELGPAASIPYGRIHQLGGMAGRGHKVRIPARPYLMVQNEDWVEIKQALTDYLTEGAK